MAGLNPIDSSVEVLHAEEENDLDGIRMAHVTLDDLKCELSRFKEGYNNGMLEEAVDTLKCNNETRQSENCIVGCLLNQMHAKEGIKNVVIK